MSKNDPTITPITDAVPQPLDSSADAQAEYWLVQLDARPDDGDLLAEFDRWYEADPAHAEAFANAELLWHSLDALATATPDEAATEPTEPAVTASGVRWRRWAMAACLLLCVSLSGWQQYQYQSDIRPQQGTVQRYQLDDGSTLFADSGSRIDLAFDAQQRNVQLKEGRLFIDVAKDGRPLSVLAGDARITAMGTRFSVHLVADAVHVSVQESRVEVAHAGRQQNLKAGEQLWILDGEIQAVQKLGSGKGLAWQKGQLVANDRSLKLVLAELNRYHPDQLLVLDEALADQHINTVLNLNQPEKALQALLSTLQLEQQALGPVRLIRRR